MVKKLKRKGVAGGPWRAFVSQQVKGRTGRPDFKELQAAYQEIKDTPDFEALKTLGQVAKRAGQRPLGKSSFGPRTREVQRQLVKASRGGLLQSTQGLSAVQKARVLAKPGPCRTQETWPSSCDRRGSCSGWRPSPSESRKRMCSSSSSNSGPSNRARKRRDNFFKPWGQLVWTEMLFYQYPMLRPPVLKCRT